MNTIGDFIVRRPVDDDAEAVHQLIVACDVADYGEPDTDLEDVRFDWRELDLDRDAWLVLAPDGRLAGYAALLIEPLGRRADTYVHPRYEDRGIHAFLLAQCEARAEELAQGGPATFRSIVSHVDEASRAALAAAGYAPSKFYFRMQIDLDAPPAKPAWPAGAALRTHVPGQDDHLVYGFVQRAFARPGRSPSSFEQWRDFAMRPDQFDPTLWFLLFHGGDLIGCALCYDFTQFGWVRHLAVEESWRRQGLGWALLQHAFRALCLRGRSRVALGVESDNPNAYRLYERMGMQRVRQYDEYRKVTTGNATQNRSQ